MKIVYLNCLTIQGQSAYYSVNRLYSLLLLLNLLFHIPHFINEIKTVANDVIGVNSPPPPALLN